MNKVFETTDGKYEVRKLSRWITIRTNYNPSPRNALWYNVMDGNGHGPHSDKFNPEEGIYLDYIRHDGQNYAINEFYALGGAWLGGAPYFFIDTDKQEHVIGALWMGGSVFGPGVYAEISEYGDAIRLFSIEPKNDASYR